jgi:hypothetical protein
MTHVYITKMLDYWPSVGFYSSIYIKNLKIILHYFLLQFDRVIHYLFIYLNQ